MRPGDYQDQGHIKMVKCKNCGHSKQMHTKDVNMKCLCYADPKKNKGRCFCRCKGVEKEELNNGI